MQVRASSVALVIGLDCSMGNVRQRLHSLIQCPGRPQASHCRFEYFAGGIVHSVFPGEQTFRSPFVVLSGLSADGNAGYS